MHFVSALISTITENRYQNKLYYLEMWNKWYHPNCLHWINKVRCSRGLIISSTFVYHVLILSIVFAFRTFSRNGDTIIPYIFHSDNDLKDAIMIYQQNYGLPQTGKLDPRIMKVVSTKRCGNPNTKMGWGYYAGSNKWEKSVATYGVWSFLYSHQLSQRTVRSIIRSAFRMWSDVVNLQFYELMDGIRPDIAIT